MKNQKEFRKDKILEVIEKGKKLSKTEIHNRIYYNFKIDVTGKTVDRDLKELLSEKLIVQTQSFPKNYVIRKDKFLSIKLRDEEVDVLKIIIKFILQYKP